LVIDVEFVGRHSCQGEQAEAGQGSDGLVAFDEAGVASSRAGSILGCVRARHSWR
jgi:hypothetical protein